MNKKVITLSCDSREVLMTKVRRFKEKHSVIDITNQSANSVIITYIC